MAFYEVDDIPSTRDVCVSVYKNDGEYMGNVMCNRLSWMQMDEYAREEYLRSVFIERRYV